MENMVDNEDQAKDFTSWNHVYVKTNKSNLHITINWNVDFSNDFEESRLCCQDSSMLDLRGTQLPEAFLIIHRCESQWIKKSKWFACTDLLGRLEWCLCCQNNCFGSCQGSVETNLWAKCAKNSHWCHPVVCFENLCLRLRACAADTTHCKTNLTVSLEDLNFCHQTKTEDSAENDPF